jgi:putative membrane-bound dehydrogenase-like protein
MKFVQLCYDALNWVTTVSWQSAYLLLAIVMVVYGGIRLTLADDNAFVVTPPGFIRPGEPKARSAETTARLQITINDHATGRPTPCRLNVVGPSGDFYQPVANRLSSFSLTGEWPKTGKGNREGKAPIRYLGRFFYSMGDVDIAVPAGLIRIEVWKGFEYKPIVQTIKVAAGELKHVPIQLERTVPMAGFGYHSGDSHLHFPRKTETDDQVILDLLEAEDIHFGSILAYNEPAGPYTGAMELMDAPQLHGLGRASMRNRGSTWIASAQEYRSTTYGHLNLYWRNSLVLAGQKVNANDWPLFGHLGRDTRQQGGFSISAHGGYSQSIYADFVQRNIDAVELLQFGIYRGIALDDWYRILNIGYRLPCVGASDYPACRNLGDCRTYIYAKQEFPFNGWLKSAVDGRSFVTTGPLLLLEVDGQPPGAVIEKTGTGPHSVHVKVRVRSEVAPVESITLIIGGETVFEQPVALGLGSGRWIEIDRVIELKQSCWIAVRVFGKAPSGAPDAEAHTNPVYVHLNDRAPYDRDSLDRLVTRIDEQMAIHRKRTFAEKAQVLDDFQKSRDILLQIRKAGGLPASGVPDDWIEDRTAGGIDPGRRTHTEEELTRFLQPLAARTPDESTKTFESANGFHMELIAAEPLVQSPVAAAFDADGNLYVAEMRDYPYKPKTGHTPLGTIRLLRDTDGDGRFDQSHVFAEGLLWAAGIAPWKGGVFVTAPPDIWYLKDNDGDGKADVRQKVYTGFGTQNQQAMVNNLTWGLDHLIYGAAAGNGGTIRPADDPRLPGVSVDRNDFRFDPARGGFEPISGSDQFGNTFDDWGNRFTCDESHPLSHPVLPRSALARNPFLTIPSAVNDILGGSVPIFRISPIERWRQIRSSRRIAYGVRSADAAGASHHVVDAGAGVTVYRGSAYPSGFYGNIFVGDAQNNLVHRRILVPDGVTFRAIRGPQEQASEFVRSSDNWFRPVNFVNAPDGTLYVLDMSRAVIEAIHIPLDVVKHLDLKQGRDQGRIYRIAPPGFRFTPPPHLSQANTDELIAALVRPDAWYRDTAHRLIYERQDQSAIKPLRKLLVPAETPLPQVRVNALWSLEGLNALRDEDIAVALSDPIPQVRAQGIQLAARRLNSSVVLLDQVAPRATDPDPRVRFNTALALGESNDPRVGNLLMSIARQDAANPWIRAAILSSCWVNARQLLIDLSEAGFSSLTPPLAELLEELAEIVGTSNRTAEISLVLDRLAPAMGDTARIRLRDRLIVALARGIRRSGGRLPVKQFQPQPGARMVFDLIEQSKAAALDGSVQESTRVEAINTYSTIEPAASSPVLIKLLDATQPVTVQIGAVRALTRDNTADVAAILLPRLRVFEPAVRVAAIQTLLTRANWTRALLQAIASNDPSMGITPALVELTDRGPLIKHSDAEIARLAKVIFTQIASPSRAGVIGEYMTVLGSKGDASRGVKVFERECMACHRVGDRGFALGPDLTGSPSRDPATLLGNILDPNANVVPGSVQYLVIDQDGRTYSGLIATETATSLTLRRGGGAQDMILRSRIAEMTSTGLSLMPEGLEKTISKPEMADLVAFLRVSHRDGESDEPSTSQPRSLDIGTLPGLIEPDD